METFRPPDEPDDPAKARRFVLPSRRQASRQQQEAIELIEARRGKVPPPFVPLLSCPEVALAFEAFSGLLWKSLPPLMLEVVFLIVARRFWCTEQWKTHEPKAVALGLSAQELGQLAETGLVDAGPLSELTRFVGALLDGVDAPEPLYRSLRETLGDEGLARLVAFTGAAVTVALLLNLNQEV